MIVGDKIPSISEISEEYLLSRDTVEKALNILKRNKIILSVKGKGYYVAKTINQSKTKILFIINRLSNYELEIFNAFVDRMGPDTQVELQVYFYDPEILTKIIQENVEAFDYYVIMPHFKDSPTDGACKALYQIQQIPEDQLVILDNRLPELGEEVASVYQDFQKDILVALEEGLDNLSKYDRITLVFPNNPHSPYPQGIKDGFNGFCNKHGFDFEVLHTIRPDTKPGFNEAYILLEENDLVNLMNQISKEKYTLGKDIGVISYNDTALKELLGITVVSTDFKAMGETAAFMVKNHKRDVIKNVFHFIDRGSV